MTCGILVVDKPAGLTSHDVVARVRRAQRTREVGHTGTLDPFATGVLVLALGEALKMAAHLTGQDKIYEAVVVLGRETDSLDHTGAITREGDVPPLGSVERPSPALLEALAGERARTAQVPPAVSAIHVDGERAHARVRRGESVDLPPRPVAVRSLELLEVGDRELRLRVHSAKGYYVRSLARDLAAALGTVGHLRALRRHRSGAFALDDARALDAPPLPLVDALRRVFPCVQLQDADRVQALRHGKRIAAEDLQVDDDVTFACFDADDVPVALVQRHEGRLIVQRGFRP